MGSVLVRHFFSCLLPLLLSLPSVQFLMASGLASGLACFQMQSEIGHWGGKAWEQI